MTSLPMRCRFSSLKILTLAGEPNPFLGLYVEHIFIRIRVSNLLFFVGLLFLGNRLGKSEVSSIFVEDLK